MSDKDLITTLNELREIDFTALDYDNAQLELIDYIRSTQTSVGVQDDFLQGDAASLFVDVFSYLIEILAFRVDTQAQETTLPTANRRQSVINLLELVSQKVKNPTAAQLTLLAVPTSISSTEISIPARHSLSGTGLDGSTVQFEIMNDPTDYFNAVVIPAGVNNFEVKSYAGSYRNLDIISTGESSITFTLPDSPVVDGSILVSVTDTAAENLTPAIIEATRVKQVDTLVEPESDIIYTVKFNADGSATLTFATQLFGKIPPAGFLIHVDYRVGGGDNTNVNIGAVSGSGTFRNAVNDPVTVSFANPDTFGQGGGDVDDLDTIKLKAPALVRANDNLVTTDDYEAIIGSIAGVKDAFAVDRYNDQTIYRSKFAVDENTVKIWVLPESGGEVSPDLKQVIEQEIGARRLTAIDNFIFSPLYTNWVVESRVVVSSTADVDEVRENITNALLDAYGFGSAQFKTSIRRSQIITTIQNITGVNYVELSQPSADIEAEENEVLRLVDNNINLVLVR